MPKITRVIATERPGVLQLPRNIPVATAEDLGAPAFRELERFGGALGQLANKLQDQADDVELAELKGQFDAGSADNFMEARKAPDFFERPAIFARDTRQLSQDLIKAASNNRVRTALTAHIVRRLPLQIVEAKADALKFMNADNAARLEQHLVNLRRQIAEQPNMEAKEELFDFGMDLINRAVQRNTIGAARGQVLRTALADDAVEAEILAAIRLDPFQAQDDLLQNIFNVDPLVKERLLRTSVVRQQELIRQDREAEREADRIFREERRIAVGDLTTRAREGTLTLDEIEQQRQVLGLGATEVNLLRSFVEAEPLGISDPRILGDVIQGINRVPPTVTERQLERLFEQHRQGGRGLNREDFVTQRDRLLRMKGASTSEAKSDIRFRHAQAQAQISRSLRFQSPFGIFDDAANQTLAVAMREFNSRSAALVPGGEDPMLLSEEIIDKFLPTFAKGAQAALDVKRAALRFQTKQSLLDAKDVIGDDAYYREVAKLREIARHERELARVQAEIQRAAIAGPVSLEPKPKAPPEAKKPPPPGLERRPAAEAPARVLPEGRETPPPARPSPLVPEPTPPPGQPTMQRRFRGRRFLTR